MAECPNCAQLREALKTRDAIATAKGLVMQRYGCTSDAAFRLLVRVSQSSNTRVNALSRSVVQAHDRGAATDAPPDAVLVY